MHVVGPFSEALRSTIQPCTFLLLAPVMLVVVAARLRLQAVIAAFGAGILGGWVFADNTFVLDGWWLRLSALPVLGVFVGLAIPAVGDRFPRLRGTTAGALGTGFVTAGATLWWRPCVGNELRTILTDAQSGVVGHPVDVAARQRREPRVGAVRSRRGAVHDHVGRQHPRQPPHQGRRRVVQPAAHRVPGGRLDVEVRDLPARMHARVGTAGDRQARRRAPEHRAERALEGALHGAQARLGSPAGETRPVVGQVQAQPHHAAHGTHGGRVGA